MVDISISVRDKALRNIAIILLIPWIITDWVFTIYILYFFQQQIWPLYGMEEGIIIWLLFIISLLLAVLILLIAIFTFQKPKSKEI